MFGPTLQFFVISDDPVSLFWIPIILTYFHIYILFYFIQFYNLFPKVHIPSVHFWGLEYVQRRILAKYSNTETFAIPDVPLIAWARYVILIA